MQANFCLKVNHKPFNKMRVNSRTQLRLHTRQFHVIRTPTEETLPAPSSLSTKNKTEKKKVKKKKKQRIENSAMNHLVHQENNPNQQEFQS